MAPGVGYLYQKMMPLDLTMTRKLALAALLTLRKPLPPSKAYAPPRATGARRRRSAVPLPAIVADNRQKTARNRGLRLIRHVWLTSITTASPSAKPIAGGKNFARPMDLAFTPL